MSEQTADTDPSVSTDGRRLTIAPRSASARVPIEYIVVTTAGSPHGMAAMAEAIPAVKMASKGSSLLMPIRSMTTNATPAMQAMVTVSLSSCFCSGVLSASVWLSRSAM